MASTHSMLTPKDAGKQSAGMGKPPMMRPSASKASVAIAKNQEEESKEVTPFAGPDSDEEFKANEEESKKELI